MFRYYQKDFSVKATSAPVLFLLKICPEESKQHMLKSGDRTAPSLDTELKIDRGKGLRAKLERHVIEASRNPE